MYARFVMNFRKAGKAVFVSSVSLVLLFIATQSKAGNTIIESDSQVNSEQTAPTNQQPQTIRSETEKAATETRSDSSPSKDKSDGLTSRQVVSGHLQAIRQQDAHKIWDFVSQEYKEDFRSPNEALRDLKNNKKLLHDHISYTLIETMDQKDSVIEKVELVTRNGGKALAFYSLKQNPDGIWKVDHITLLETDSRAI